MFAVWLSAKTSSPAAQFCCYGHAQNASEWYATINSSNKKEQSLTLLMKLHTLQEKNTHG